MGDMVNSCVSFWDSYTGGCRNAGFVEPRSPQSSLPCCLTLSINGFESKKSTLAEDELSP